jgi:hypothetical protein
MVQKKNPAVAKIVAPSVAKKPVHLQSFPLKDEVIVIPQASPPVKEVAPKVAAKAQPIEVKLPAPEKVKATEPKELSPIDKWNAVKALLIQKFPIFQPCELDIINCTIEDVKAHVRTQLRMTDKEIAAIIPGY